jgi:GTPase SAR1 family protein
MPTKKRDRQLAEHELPRGVKLVRTLEGHEGDVTRLAFDPEGGTLATASFDHTAKLWEVASGKLLRTLKGHTDIVCGVSFDPRGRRLASASSDRTVKLWEVATGKLLRTLEGHKDIVYDVPFKPRGRTLASASGDKTLKLWNVPSGKLLRTIRAHNDLVMSLAFDPAGRMLASGSRDGTVKVWDVITGKLQYSLKAHRAHVYSVPFHPAGRLLATAGSDRSVKLWQPSTGDLLRTLEGHTAEVDIISFSSDGRLLASKSRDGTVRLWSCESWETVAVIPELTSPMWNPGLAFHPTLPLLAAVGQTQTPTAREPSRYVHFWELDLDVLLGRAPEVKSSMKAVHHTTAKMVLVGDSGVGKTGLGWRLAHGEFKEHSSTHGQQFWVVDALSKRRSDGTECEAILWDLAGQPDYRLTHALSLDDADLALVLFDPTDSRDPLRGVEFWLKQLKAGQAVQLEVRAIESEERQCGVSTILVGARADRGEARLTQEELDAFCQQRGIDGGYLSTSAFTGRGLKELQRRMKYLIPWDQKPATVTTASFKRVKDYVLGLKENRRRRKVIVSSQDLRKRLEKTDRHWELTDAEMMTAVKHLANYGYVRVLRTSKSEERILLAPELLNNLASSFVLEARRNLKGLGSLDEKRLLVGDYPFRELEKLSREERDVLLDSAALLFLEHNVCFRETTLDGQSYLVFPELINLKKPLLEDETKTEDSMAYTVSGAVENVYASLVVLLGYTRTFTRTNQWQNQARYVMGDGSVCGFRQESEHDGELEFVLYFGTDVLKSGRKIFEGMFEGFLARRNLNVFRYEPVICSKGHPLNRTVVRDELRSGHDSAFCSRCGEKLALPKAHEPIQLTQAERQKVEEQQSFAARRSSFEQAVFQLVSYIEGQKLARPECFISYAWGDAEQERWVERSLATDLRKAGLIVVFDRWENERVGASVSRFVERIEKCDRIIMVGTPTYRRKYENKDTSTGHVVAAEVDLISNRLLGTEAQKESVMPVLLAGEKTSSLPPLLHSRVFGDFRDERKYFITAFDLILDLYGIPHTDPAVTDLRESLRDREMR